VRAVSARLYAVVPDRRLATLGKITWPGRNEQALP